MSEGENLRPFLARLAEGATLSVNEAERAFSIIMSGAATPAQIAAFLMALRLRGETVDEITGGAQVLRSQARRVRVPAEAIDVCGTGGDGAHTFNVSTAVALVVAACGVPVAKHGNRAASSKSGTADVLQRLGVNIELAPEQVEHCIEEAGVGFMFAPVYHAAMKNVAPVRGELGHRTVFNLLGPLANPAQTKRQLLGVPAKRWVEVFAQVLRNLGVESVWVVHGSDGIDEITTTGVTYVAELKGGSIRSFEVSPEEAGLKRSKLEQLRGGDPDDNAAALRRLLSGAPGPYRDIVVLNSAAALVVSSKAKDVATGAKLAREAIDSGQAMERLDKLIAASNA
jgi:anthranilate phosphoribosyltransferase